MSFILQDNGDYNGLLCDENYLVFKWSEGDVFFSVCRKGNAANCHFSSRPSSLRQVKQAIDDFCCFMFDSFDWCTMVLAITKKPSVGRLIKKCGFTFVSDINDLSVYMRTRSWVE